MEIKCHAANDINGTAFRCGHLITGTHFIVVLVGFRFSLTALQERKTIVTFGYRTSLTIISSCRKTTTIKRNLGW